MSSIANKLNFLGPLAGSSWTNPWYRPFTPQAEKAGMSYGLHAATDLSRHANNMKDGHVKTMARVVAFAVDCFTSIFGNPVALLYNGTIGAARNMLIRRDNRKSERKVLEARTSWKPTSYRAFATYTVLAAAGIVLAVAAMKMNATHTTPSNNTTYTIPSNNTTLPTPPKTLCVPKTTCSRPHWYSSLSTTKCVTTVCPKV